MSNNKYKVLIVEDDANICSFIKTVLEANGYQALSASNCAQGKMMITSYVPDLIILDLGLPDADGTEVIRFVRETSSTAIVVLSARSNELDKVVALDMGANDYITKPFGTEELLARVRVALRNRRQEIGATNSSKFVLAGLEIDYDKRQVFVQGNEVKLTQTEYNILAFLSEHVGKIMTYAVIIRSVWGVMDSGSVKKLQVNMASIRKKLGFRVDDENTHYIINELGVGYRMLEESEIE